MWLGFNSPHNVSSGEVLSVWSVITFGALNFHDILHYAGVTQFNQLPWSPLLASATSWSLLVGVLTLFLFLEWIWLSEGVVPSPNGEAQPRKWHRQETVSTMKILQKCAQSVIIYKGKRFIRLPTKSQHHQTMPTARKSTRRGTKHNRGHPLSYDRKWCCAAFVFSESL